jgi:hypothetical protein
MKRTLVGLTLGLSLLAWPAAAQEASRTAPLTRSDVLEQAASKLGELAPTDRQMEGLMQLFLSQLPRLMDDNVDPLSLAKEIQPQAERLLDAEQIHMLRAMSAETGPLMEIGKMGREERRALVRGGLERLSHPDMNEWLKRIDSFDI